MKRAVCLALALLAPTTALADQAAAESCAAALPAPAKLIYAAAAPDFAAAADPKGFVKSKVVALVQAGTIQRSEARSSAMAAGDCLKKLK